MKNNHHNVTFLVNSLVQGGAENQVRRISIGLSQRGWNVSVVTLTNDDSCKKDLMQSGVTVMCLNINNLSSLIFNKNKISKMLNRFNNGILVSFLFQSDVVARVFGRRAGFEHIVSSIRNENIGGRGREFILKLLDHRVNLVTTNSHKIANLMKTNKKVTKKDVRVVYNALDLNGFISSIERDRTEKRKELGIPLSSFVWISMGRMRPQKNYVGLLKAFSKLENCSDTSLIIAGQYDKRTQLTDEIKKYGLSDKIKILGPREDVAELLNASDAFVLASHHEGSPNSLIEASALGLPSVCTDVGGINEIISNGKTGFLVTPGSTEMLREAMDKLMSLNDTQLKIMGEMARDDILNKHDYKHVLESWEEIFNEVTGV